MLRTAIVTVALFLVAVSPSAAEPTCVDRTQVIEHLAQRYHETPVAVGVASNGGLIEVLASREGNSWTIIITMPNGVACMVAAGRDWATVPHPIVLDPDA
jgi:hypothetical protein